MHLCLPVECIASGLQFWLHCLSVVLSLQSNQLIRSSPPPKCNKAAVCVASTASSTRPCVATSPGKHRNTLRLDGRAAAALHRQGSAACSPEAHLHNRHPSAQNQKHQRAEPPAPEPATHVTQRDDVNWRTNAVAWAHGRRGGVPCVQVVGVAFCQPLRAPIRAAARVHRACPRTCVVTPSAGGWSARASSRNGGRILRLNGGQTAPELSRTACARRAVRAPTVLLRLRTPTPHPQPPTSNGKVA